MNWYEQLGCACADAFSLREGQGIDHDVGTVWITDVTGQITAITSMTTEGENEISI